MKKFRHNFFIKKYWYASSIMNVDYGQNLWHVAQYLFCHMAY
jgi:hypothetical protein